MSDEAEFLRSGSVLNDNVPKPCHNPTHEPNCEGLQGDNCNPPKVTIQDCGCRSSVLSPGRPFLCAYHEGFEDGMEEARDQIVAAVEANMTMMVGSDAIPIGKRVGPYIRVIHLIKKHRVGKS